MKIRDIKKIFVVYFPTTLQLTSLLDVIVVSLLEIGGSINLIWKIAQIPDDDKIS